MTCALNSKCEETLSEEVRKYPLIFDKSDQEHVFAFVLPSSATASNSVYFLDNRVLILTLKMPSSSNLLSTTIMRIDAETE